ncbi:hypothetical protein NDU88_005235 [Pleurodeles waltl]|uniref:Uncharacterized protein n=1 Tax=Pleurodeles waltl TaxID=8319 RepID=A0AAV7RKF9_PLEWA|nr:hypothetical protein NDU88_005235 [Pleurodeles waltl]
MAEELTSVGIMEASGDMRLILTEMQCSVTKSDGKIDIMSFRMYRMSDCLDKHKKHLNMVKRQVYKVEDEQVSTLAAQQKLDKALTVLQAMAEDLGARLRHNNIWIVELAVSTNTGKMEKFME